MPKMKSHSGAKKRFRVTKKGKVVYKTSGARHLLIGMRKKRRRHLKSKQTLPEGGARVIKALLPYG
ncbi:50S ribosomal protein L35 [Elusimicrobiota bacterium]